MKNPQVRKDTFKRFRRRPKAVKEVEPDLPELDDLLVMMRNKRNQNEDGHKRFLQLEEKAIAMMREHGLKNYKGKTLVEGEGVELLVDKFKQRITPKQWDMITRRVVDPDLLKAACDRGVIDPTVVKLCSVVKERKPYIRGY